MQVGLAQISCVPGKIADNLEKVTSYISEAAAQQCDVVLFPEVSDTGYEMGAINKFAKSWKESPFTGIAAAAAERKINVICGLSEREGDKLYNSIAVISRKGELLARYRKIHLFGPSGETQYFQAGDKVVALEIEQKIWGLSICFDLRFPELYRALTKRGAQVLVNCTAWLTERASHWETLLRARALENQAFVVGVNRVGTDSGVEFCGTSLIYSPLGNELVRGHCINEQLLIADLDLNQVDENRKNFPVLTSTRAEIYSRS